MEIVLYPFIYISPASLSSAMQQATLCVCVFMFRHWLIVARYEGVKRDIRHDWGVVVFQSL